MLERHDGPTGGGSRPLRRTTAPHGAGLEEGKLGDLADKNARGLDGAGPKAHAR